MPDRLAVAFWIAALPGAVGMQGAPPAPVPVSPQMERLQKTFVGEWDTLEKHSATAFTREGTRRGSATFRSGPGGRSLIEDYEARGSAGELHWLGVIWWDSGAGTYRFFTCDNFDPCEMRGTARWDSDKFVNTWEAKIQGRPTALRDSFVNISSDSFTLVAEAGAEGAAMTPMITTRYTRRPGKRVSGS